MKKWVKIGFPIACVVIVGGTLVYIGNLKKQAERIPSNNLNISNSSVSNNTNYNFKDSNKTPIINISEMNTNTNINKNTTNKVNTNTYKNNINTAINNNFVNNVSVNNNVIENNTSEETDKDYDKKDDKEKAIELVSKEWGEDSEVYYTNEGISSGYYIVAVRDKSNTSVKMFYKVDINNNIVEPDW